MAKTQKNFFGVMLILLLGWMLTRSAIELYNIAWETGNWLGEFSLRWGLAFFAFIGFSLLILILFWMAFWTPDRLGQWKSRLVAFRGWIGIVRWPIVLVLLFVLPYLFQYSRWGAVINQPFLRFTAWCCVVFLVAFFLTREIDCFIRWAETITAILLSGGLFVLISSLGGVTSYPFSLGWSEGNRLWDYSLLFGSDLYNYAGNKPSAYLDIGRQLIGGLPFLISGVTIFQARLWLGIVTILPYLILGWIAFRFRSKSFDWVLAGFWAFMFLRQGPIHPPLLMGAIFVAIAWGQPLWLAAPLIGGAAYFAQASRFTWVFAPAIWAVMLEYSGGSLAHGKVSRIAWWRGFVGGLAGLIGGLIIPKIIGFLQLSADSGVSVNQVTGAIARQPLLWFRLFPNETYSPGILLGTLLAVGPLVVILFHWSVSKHWAPKRSQKLAMSFALSAFFVVGIIISTKIGGGGDLHNLDMFLIGLLFTAAIAWKNGSREWLKTIEPAPVWMKFALVLLVAIPAYQPLMRMHPLAYGENLDWVARLTDVEETRFLGSLADSDQVDSALEKIRNEVTIAQGYGEILFMDQRQLLTFGYLQGLVLVPEYEKKLLMDKALGSELAFFEPFYRDIASQRFSLIISEILQEGLKRDDHIFGEENNAWVLWVTKPILCYYEPLKTLDDVDVQLLTPRQEVEQNCPLPSPGSE